MNFDLQRILEGKRVCRRKLAARPIAEKLRILDALRERELAIRNLATPSHFGVLREKAGPYQAEPP